MIKTITKVLMVAILSSIVVSCGENNLNPEQPKKSSYTERQLKVFEVLNGTFVYTNTYVPSLKTTLVFSKNYDEPLIGEDKEGEKVPIHGEVRVLYYNGDSYNRFYYLSPNADCLIFYGKYSHYLGDYYSGVDVYDLDVKDANTLLLKQKDSYMWDRYIKQ